ncbi:MAG: hypothetical protein QM677_02495 [Microbacterium sp.]
MVTAELIDRLKSYVIPGATSVSTADDAFILACLEEAVALVDQFCGITNGDTSTSRVPESILQRAYIEVGSELFNRRSAPNGISQFTTADGAAIRVARDPLVAARPLVQPYLPLGVS